MELREKLEGMYKCTCIDAYKNRDMVDPTCLGCEFKSAIPEILSIINEPLTVEVECDKCGGHVHSFKCSGQTQVAYCECGKSVYTQNMKKHPCPHCDNGKVKRVIVWEGGNADKGKTTWHTSLTVNDLRDSDIAFAYGMLADYQRLKVKQSNFKHAIPNNKGTLRLEDK